MKKLNHAVVKSSLLAIAVFSAGVQAQTSEWQESFSVGTASQGGTYYIYLSGWANMISSELGLSGGAEVTGGPVQNLALVNSGELAFAGSTTGAAADAMAGRSPLAPGLVMDNVCAMFPLYETPFALVSLSNSGIDTIDSIPDGARVGFGPAGGTSDTYFTGFLDLLGVDYSRRNGGWNDLAGQLQDGMIDAVAFAAGNPIPAIMQLEAQTDVNIIEFSEEEQAQILNDFPVSAYQTPANSYSSLENDVRTVSMWNFTIANCDLPEDFVYEVTRLTMEDNDRMVSIHNSAKTTVPENAVHNTVIPFHPGAARWFNENGYEIEASLIH